MKQIFTILFLIISIATSKAQIDTEFWFVAPEVSNQHGDEPLFLRIVSYSQAASVTFSMPANPAYTPLTITLNANSVQSINLTSIKSTIENFPADQCVGCLGCCSYDSISLLYHHL